MAEIAEPERSPAELRELASPGDLYLAFLYELAIFVRQGPRNSLSPAALLQLAHRAAETGAVSWSTSVELRGRLAKLQAELRAAGAWHPERPLWWEPLPPSSPAEVLWARLEEAWSSRTAETSPVWQIFPELLTEEILRSIMEEIEEDRKSTRLNSSH